jgi:hypothetical protein
MSAAPLILPRPARRRARHWLAAVVYPTPDLLQSLEQAERFYHNDLPHLTVVQLQRERDQARLRATVEPQPHDEWLVERRQRIAGELARRQQRGCHGK